MLQSVFQCGLRAAIAATCVGLSTAALADRAPPDKISAAVPVAEKMDRSEPLPLRLERDAESPTHRIVIPKAVLAKLAGDLPGADPIASVTPARSIAAALALSAAVAVGLVASRRGRPGRLAAVVLCGLAATGAGGLLTGNLAFADLAAPGQPRGSRPRPAAAAPAFVTLAQGGKVILEIGEAGGDAVILVVGTEAVDTDQKEPQREPRGSVAPPPG
jgi:hypothetical protein